MYIGKLLNSVTQLLSMTLCFKATHLWRKVNRLLACILLIFVWTCWRAGFNFTTWIHTAEQTRLCTTITVIMRWKKGPRCVFMAFEG